MNNTIHTTKYDFPDCTVLNLIREYSEETVKLLQVHSPCSRYLQFNFVKKLQTITMWNAVHNIRVSMHKNTDMPAK